MNLYWITYNSENGDVVPDAKMREYVDSFIASGKRSCTIGSVALIDEFRMLVARGVVEGGQLRIGTPDSEFFPVNEYAVLKDYPESLFDKNTHELLMFATRKRTRVLKEVGNA